MSCKSSHTFRNDTVCTTTDKTKNVHGSSNVYQKSGSKFSSKSPQNWLLPLVLAHIWQKTISMVFLSVIHCFSVLILFQHKASSVILQSSIFLVWDVACVVFSVCTIKLTKNSTLSFFFKDGFLIFILLFFADDETPNSFQPWNNQPILLEFV